jgi:hypothetical protein
LGDLFGTMGFRQPAVKAHHGSCGSPSIRSSGRHDKAGG